MPPEGASAEELGQTLAAILEWLVKARLADLLDAGLSHADVFRLVTAADDYRKGQLCGDTLATIHDLAPMLDEVKI
jgi:hypothetical protein